MERRGQVQVLESMLLLFIVVSLWILVWIWFYPQYWESYQAIENGILSSELKRGERVLIENVLFEESGGASEIRVFLSNVGSVDLAVGSLYLNDTLVWSGELKLPAGDTSWLSSTVTSVCESGRICRVKVCTTRGNCWEVRIRAP